MSAWHVMVVDDDREMRDSLVDLIEAAGWRATALARAVDAGRRIAQDSPDVILTDVRMPGMSGLDLLESLDRKTSPPVVLISAHGDIPMAVEAIQNGAYGFVEKPYSPSRLLSVLSHASEQHTMRVINRRLRSRLAELSGLDRILVGQTAGMERIRAEILDLAGSPAAVLVQGETGTGKELVARALHDLGPRSSGPFHALNCATMTPEGLREGTLAAGSGGTLFLDEIALCPPEVQAMLLREIEESTSPAEGRRPHLDLRVLSATNENPETSVRQGRLRPDLLFRLNTLTLVLPSLRIRPDDIALTFSHFLAEAALAYEIAPPELTEDDLAALMAHDWPGNVRELRSVAERRVLQARRGTGSVAAALALDEVHGDVPPTLREAVAAFERELIGKAIRAHEGRMDAVAEALGIARRTLNEKIVKLGLDKDALL
ncbi:MAG: sigma-54-dependent Fis family transcriptional regulator [Boseongicola sp. SB0677_bin_26]|nr:sigma-54-dependent Fis family transcriptional regulator [Boseongicola sp. SB0665_bin_10]MYG26164.1 sigma-54-dependent Fis family transcriptional regulator [Boseongicola sp. SB0677_bin_26]